MAENFYSLDEAIESSEFSERIKFLLENPRLGYGPVVRRNEDYIESSNCWGTTAFLVDAQKEILANWEHREIESGKIIKVETSRPDRPSFFFADNSRPGYTDSVHLKWFLKERCLKSITPIFNSILSMIIMNYDGDGCPEGTVFHTGLFLGKIQDKPMYVEQDGLGGAFKTQELNGRLDIRDMAFYKIKR